MTAPQQRPDGSARPRPKSLAERADELHDHQMRLKEEAAARRKEAAASGITRPSVGLSQTGHAGRGGGR